MFGAAPGRETIFIFCIKLFVIGCAFSFSFFFFVPEMGEIILKARGERGLFFLKISDFSKECFYNLTHNSTLIHLTDSRAFNFLGGGYFFLTSGRDERSIRELKCESLSAPWQRSVV